MSPPRGTGRIGGSAWRAARSATSASADSTGCASRSATPMSTPSWSRSSAMARIASSECPPNSKKCASAPIRAASTSSTCAQIAAIARAVGVAGATYSAAVPGMTSGSGSALSSILPLPVSGIVAPTAIACGSMYSGRPARRKARRRRGNPRRPIQRRARIVAARHPRQQRLSFSAPRTATAACCTRGCACTGLDLVQFDAEPAQLHLAVAAADEFDPAVLAPAAEVAGAVQAATGAPRVGRNCAALSSGRLR